jgi:site-specific DNA recombinase
MAHILDPVVWAAVENVLLKPDIIATEVERRRGSDPFAGDLETLERRLRSIDNQQRRLSRAVALVDDDEAAAPLLVELRQLGVESKALRLDQQQLRRRAADHDADTNALNNITSWCHRVSKNLSTLTYQEKRLILDALGVSVRVFRADHEPRWEITMAPLPIKVSAESPFVFNNPCGACG